MPNEEKKEEVKVNLELAPSEIFQMHLCVLTRMGDVQIKFCNAHNEAEQKSAEGLLTYLTMLDTKILNAIKELETNGKK